MRRIIALILVTWVPLAALSVIAGHATAGVSVPFFQTIGPHVRFLIVVPLLVAAEVIVHRRIIRSVREFIDRRLVAPQNEVRFNNAIAAALRLRNSATIESCLFLVAFTFGFWLWREYVAIHASTWYSLQSQGERFTMAGYWYAFVSLPLVRFLILRWYFRIFVWYYFLWKVSRIPLQLNALHPDRAGGLRFLESTPFAFIPVLLALTALLAGEIADRIWHQGASLTQFKGDIFVVLLFSILLVYAPLTFFVMQLYNARWLGRREYGSFGVRYVTDFRSKWILRDASQESATALGTGDIQSLADLANSFDVVREMRLVPFALKSVLALGAFVLVPIAPLLFTIMPIEEMIDRIIKLFL